MFVSEGELTGEALMNEAPQIMANLSQTNGIWVTMKFRDVVRRMRADSCNIDTPDDGG
jgi:hypothetical protein